MKKIKRRKNKYNPYNLEIDHILTFIDSKGIKQRILLNDELYKEFNSFELQDLKEMNEYDRHIEHLELTEGELYHSTKNRYVSLEDIVLRKIIYEKLNHEINRLPEIQKRRLKMYYFEDKTLQEIAKIEKCSKVAIKYSIDTAIKNIHKNLKM